MTGQDEASIQVMNGGDVPKSKKQAAREALHSLPFAKMLGMRLADIRPGEAVVEITISDEHRQPAGLLHGGVTASLIDTAMAFAVITRLDDGERATTVDLTVHYLRPLFEGNVSCTARVVRAGRRVFTVSADVFGSGEKLIATAVSTYMKV